jgi:alkylresorcinol/alkylpyrone synthase
MLQALPQNTKKSTAPVAIDVDILSLATAVPKHKAMQRDLVQHAKTLFPFIADLDEIFAHAGVDERYLCESQEWYFERHGWEERTRTFHEHALELAEEVTRKAVDAADLELSDIDVLVTSTSTGVGAPGFDCKLLNRIDLPETVERVPLFGLGCGGGLGALQRAARIAQGMPGANVLVVIVDLPSLCFTPSESSLVQLIGGAIFGDGAAGLVVRSSEANRNGHGGPRIAHVRAIGDHFWRDTEHMTKNDVRDEGFALVLSKDIPNLLLQKYPPVVARFLDRAGLRMDDFDGFLFHPGSSRVLEMVQEGLGLSREQLHHSWEVLRQYSNTSSPTVLFVFERGLNSGCRGRHLLTAMGPGFSAYFAVVDL